MTPTERSELLEQIRGIIKRCYLELQTQVAWTTSDMLADRAGRDIAALPFFASPPADASEILLECPGCGMKKNAARASHDPPNAVKCLLYCAPCSYGAMEPPQWYCDAEGREIHPQPADAPPPGTREGAWYALYNLVSHPKRSKALIAYGDLRQLMDRLPADIESSVTPAPASGEGKREGD